MRLVLLALAAALAGCTSGAPSAPTTPLTIQAVVRAGETVTLPEASLRLKFIGVMGDSRCPADAMCILGGDAVVRIEVQSTSGGHAIYDLHTGSLEPRAA